MMQPDSVPASVDLFVYGSLLFDEVVRALTNRIFPAQQATLRGFVRHAILRHGDFAPYPAIQPDASCSVSGRLLMSADADSIRWIDCFESDPSDYKSVPVVVECADGKLRRATTYVALASLRPHLAGEWSMEAFRRNALDDYVTRVIPQLRRELRLRG